MVNFANRLIILAKVCSFEDVTVIEYKKESILQSFISGLEDPYIKQRILEKDANLEGALEAAEILTSVSFNTIYHILAFSLHKVL